MITSLSTIIQQRGREWRVVDVMTAQVDQPQGKS